MNHATLQVLGCSFLFFLYKQVTRIQKKVAISLSSTRTKWEKGLQDLTRGYNES